MEQKKYNIMVVSDFFYPSVGGVENHIIALSKSLIKNGHNVIVVTRSYGRSYLGLRNFGSDDLITDGCDNREIAQQKSSFSVIYLPLLPLLSTTVFPSFLNEAQWFYKIVNRFKIDIVHLHQSYSTLSITFTYHASLMGIPTVFTEHSLAICIDRLDDLLLSGFRKMAFSISRSRITVSKECEENMVVMRNVPLPIHVIPNPVPFKISSSRPPDFKLCSSNNNDDSSSLIAAQSRRNIRVGSFMRLTSRKGAELLYNFITYLRDLRYKIIATSADETSRESAENAINFENSSMGTCLEIVVTFVIAGDGPFFPLFKKLEQNINNISPFTASTTKAPLGNSFFSHSLLIKPELELLGEIPHSNVDQVMKSIDIILIPSITESFCIVFCEAILNGILPLSTNADGIRSLYSAVSPILQEKFMFEPKVCNIFECLLNYLNLAFYGNNREKVGLKNELSRAAGVVRKLCDPQTVCESVVNIYNDVTEANDKKTTSTNAKKAISESSYVTSDVSQVNNIISYSGNSVNTFVAADSDGNKLNHFISDNNTNSVNLLMTAGEKSRRHSFSVYSRHTLNNFWETSKRMIVGSGLRVWFFVIWFCCIYIVEYLWITLFYSAFVKFQRLFIRRFTQ